MTSSGSRRSHMFMQSLIEAGFFISIRLDTPNFRNVLEGSFSTKGLVLIRVEQESKFLVLLFDGVVTCFRIELQDAIAI